jgi:hypothetical protein
LLMARMLCCTCVCGIAHFAGFPESDIRRLHRLLATATQGRRAKEVFSNSHRDLARDRGGDVVEKLGTPILSKPGFLRKIRKRRSFCAPRETSRWIRRC